MQTQTQNASEALAALPKLAPGLTVAVLKRVWFATPATERKQAETLLTSSVRVERGMVMLPDLTLAEVEARIGAVTPKAVVRYYEPGKLGVQVATFVEHTDAVKFASTKKLYSNPAKAVTL